MARHLTAELDEALDVYEREPSAEHKLEILSAAMGYCQLLKRHIQKENEVVYPFAERALPREVLEQLDRDETMSGTEREGSFLAKRQEAPPFSPARNRYSLWLKRAVGDCPSELPFRRDKNPDGGLLLRPADFKAQLNQGVQLLF